MIRDARDQLRYVYDQATSDESKRIAKARVVAELRLAYSRLRQSWVDGNEFEYWMQDDINNAKLSAVGAYQDWAPAFLILLEQSESFEKFVARVNEVAELDKEQRSEFLIRLSQ